MPDANLFLTFPVFFPNQQEIRQCQPASALMLSGKIDSSERKIFHEWNEPGQRIRLDPEGKIRQNMKVCIAIQIGNHMQDETAYPDGLIDLIEIITRAP